MSLINRLKKLEDGLKPAPLKVYYFGWANSEFKYSNGLSREPDETKDQFCRRVYEATKKQFLWFD